MSFFNKKNVPVRIITVISLIIFLFPYCKLESKTKQDQDHYPNIIYILADDLGYGDVSALNPSSKIYTPNIDKIVNEGAYFTNAHSNSAVCTPTRYGILTGRYCFRTHLKKWVLGGYDEALIEPKRLTVASLLKQSGYQTACIGKWHLGLNWKAKDETKPLVEARGLNIINSGNVDYDANISGGPNNLGFDYSYIIPASLDIPPYVYIEDHKITSPVNKNIPALKSDSIRGVKYRKGDIADGFDHNLTLEHFTNKAIKYIKSASQTGKPFFLYFPLTAPHTPWLPAEEFKNTTGAGTYGDFSAMVDNMVGKILKTLIESGVDGNTMVIFTSDNGSHWLPSDIEKFGHKANYVFKGMKSDIWEGGHHVPFLIRWPQKIKPSLVCNKLISTTDFLATCAEMVRYNLPNDAGEDSYSFWTELTNSDSLNLKRETIICHSGDGIFSIQKGKWKYIQAKGSGGWSLPEGKTETADPPGQLYDLSVDPGETQNLFFDNIAIAIELDSLLNKQISQGYSRKIK